MSSRFWNIIRAFIGFRRFKTVTVSAALSAPVLTKTSGAGAAPFLWDCFVAADIYAGYFRRIQVSTSPTFSSLIYTGDGNGILHQITPSEFASPNDAPIAGFATPTGTFYLRERFERDNGDGSVVVSNWSNTIGDTITAPATIWDSAKKHRSLVLSGSPALTATGVDWNAGQPVRGNSFHSAGAGGLYGFEVTYTTQFAAGKIFAGFVDPAMTDYGQTSGFPEPGVGANASLGAVYESSGIIRPSGAGVAACSTGDIIGCWVRPGLGKCWFSKNGTFLNGDPVAGTGGESLGSTDFYPVAGTFRADVLTGNFGQTAFANTPSGGLVWG